MEYIVLHTRGKSQFKTEDCFFIPQMKVESIHAWFRMTEVRLYQLGLHPTKLSDFAETYYKRERIDICTYVQFNIPFVFFTLIQSN